MNEPGVAPGRPVPTIIRFAVLSGVRPDELLHAAGIDLALIDPDEGVPQHLRMRLWDEASRLAGDPDFGVHMAEWVCKNPEEHFDVLAFAVRSCATLADHYRRMERYVRLIHEGTFFTLEIEPHAARLVHGLIDDPRSPRHAVECMLAMAVLQARRSAGDDFTPQEVRFAHLAPASAREQKRIFRAPVHYGCARNEVVVNAVDLERPQHQAEPRLQMVLERQLEDLMSRLPQERSLPGRVKSCLSNHLLDGEPAVGAIAAKLHMSPRTLQRKLNDEGTSFARVLADLRTELAQRYLGDRRRTINEVAFLLGFAEVSAFHKAFKRWTGKTPAEFQRMARSS
jgi:AraC-like DNA-binding protein